MGFFARPTESECKLFFTEARACPLPLRIPLRKRNGKSQELAANRPLTGVPQGAAEAVATTNGVETSAVPANRSTACVGLFLSLSPAT